MVDVVLYRAALVAVRKQAHKTTARDRAAIADFIEAIRSDPTRYLCFLNKLGASAVFTKNHLAGKTFHSEEQIREALGEFAKGEPIRSTLRQRAIYFVKSWHLTALEEHESHQRETK